MKELKSLLCNDKLLRNFQLKTFVKSKSELIFLLAFDLMFNSLHLPVNPEELPLSAADPPSQSCK